MKKILITGTAGFIYGNFIRKAIYEQNQKPPQDRQYSFVSIDRVSVNNNSMYWNKSHTFHVADIRDAHVMDVIFQFEKPDIVLHGAAETFVDTSLKDPNIFITSNVLGTQNIINACLKHKVEKLVYQSTDEIYGQLVSENDKSWTEENEMVPRNPYAASKAAGELLIKAAHHSHGLIYNIVRSSNCYGPRQLAEKLIPKVIKCILNNEKILLYGEGKQIRDWTHVSDNCSAVMTILENGTSNEIYNVSANQEFSNLEVIHEICNYMKKGHDLIDFIKDPRGGGHDFRYSVDSSKIKNLGWKPEIQFKKHLGTSCIDWFVDNSWWFR